MAFKVAEGRRAQSVREVTGRCETLRATCAWCKLKRGWPPDELSLAFPAHATVQALAERFVCRCGSRDGEVSFEVDARLAAERNVERTEQRRTAGTMPSAASAARRGRRSESTDLRAFNRIPHGNATPMQDHRRYPGCRLLLFCGACTVAKGYSPERIIDRLRALKAGGHDTKVADVARSVGWPCPTCGRMRWATQLAYPVGLGEREAKRLANVYRN